MTYDEALAYIASLEPRGWRLGLDRMQAFVSRAGLDDSIGSTNGPQFIQVAGTNGKGSTTAFLQSLFVESGYRTGAYFSPYVVDPRERVQFGRDLIPKQDLADVTALLKPIVETFSDTDFGGVTEFELKTAMGLQYWKQMVCEWVALEVGLGGRLDATSVVTPRAGIIVSIGLDHMHILGDTLAKIAAEKAGIIKQGVPVIVGDMPDEAANVIVAGANELDAPVWRYGKEVVWLDESCGVRTPNGDFTGLRPGIPGAAQKHNLSLAVAAMAAAGAVRDEASLRRGAEHASIPGRFQVLTLNGRTVVLDGAHNPDAARVLAKSLDAQFVNSKVVLVTNMLSGHEPTTFYEVLRERVSSVVVVPVDFHRATPVETMVGELKLLFKHVKGFESPVAGLNAAVALAEENDIVLVTGTFYLVGELLRSWA